MSDSSIFHVINPKSKDLGDDFVVRRSLPDMKKRSVGPFVFWDHMGPVQITSNREMKVRAHPHIGLATITYLFSGQILHRDSLGNELYIRPGEVNWMTAGSGIAHSERSFEVDQEFQLEGIQLWLGLPVESEEVAASFVHEKEDQLPLIECGQSKLRLIAGELSFEDKESVKSPLPVYSKLFYCFGTTQKDHQFKLQLPTDEEAAVYVINGRIKIEGQSYSRFQMVIYKLGSLIEFEAEEDAEFMIFGGVPFPEKRHMWWNFVSSDLQKIEQAKARWKNQEFGPVLNETEIIPLPAN